MCVCMCVPVCVKILRFTNTFFKTHLGAGLMEQLLRDLEDSGRCCELQAGARVTVLPGPGWRKEDRADLALLRELGAGAGAELPDPG